MSIDAHINLIDSRHNSTNDLGVSQPAFSSINVHGGNTQIIVNPNNSIITQNSVSGRDDNDISEKLFLFVTANENESNALFEDSDFFKYEVKHSSNLDDVNFYNVGKFGEYHVVHFELQEQGSARADSSFISIYDAINEFRPDAVLLIGVAFGKDYGSDAPEEQRIGDVLISKTVVDYESGKIKNGMFASDGVIAQSGRALLSVFSNKHKSWRHLLATNRQARCYFGQVLSGDKVVDNKEFKEALLQRYPRAIGGEMEGRGAYGACRRKGLSEWIIIKSICDWGDGTKNTDKQVNQVCAARSTVSLLKHVFSDIKSFDVLQKHIYEVTNSLATPKVTKSFANQPAKKSPKSKNAVNPPIQQLTGIDKADALLKEAKGYENKQKYTDALQSLLVAWEIYRCEAGIESNDANRTLEKMKTIYMLLNKAQPFEQWLISSRQGRLYDA